jgi:hypothetical protein
LKRKYRPRLVGGVQGGRGEEQEKDFFHARDA